MKIKDVSGEGAQIEFSLVELDLLRNGLNEARLAVKGDADFETRLGSPKSEADSLIAALKSLIGDVIDNRDGSTPLSENPRERVKS